jgi:hypothetical protein
MQAALGRDTGDPTAGDEVTAALLDLYTVLFRSALHDAATGQILLRYDRSASDAAIVLGSGVASSTALLHHVCPHARDACRTRYALTSPAAVVIAERFARRAFWEEAARAGCWDSTADEVHAAPLDSVTPSRT